MMWSLRSIATLFLFAVPACTQSIQFDAPWLIAWVHEETREAVLQLRITNGGTAPIDVAVSFNQTFSTDATAVPSPGDSALEQRSLPIDEISYKLDPSAVNAAISGLFTTSRGKTQPKTLVIPIAEIEDQVAQHAPKVIECLKTHGSGCEHVAWRADSECRPNVRVMRYIGLIALDYDDTITKCTHEDISADIDFLDKHFTLLAVELDEEEPAAEIEVDDDEEEATALAKDPMFAPFAPKITDPNDPEFHNQWHLHYLNITEVWAEIGQFPKHFKPLIAVIDSGVHFDHPDLQGNLWINEAELNGLPGVDDDGNGYIDDIYGWVVQADGSKKPLDSTGVGTHVLGLISAVPNNHIGVSSVAGVNVKTAMCRRTTWGGNNSTSLSHECQDWAMAIGAHFTTKNRHGDFHKSPVPISAAKKRVYDALMARKQVYVTLAGNNYIEFGPPNIEGYFYDGCYNYPFMVTVANIDREVQLLPSSNRGENCVTLAAPGNHVWATGDPAHEGGKLYVRKNGTARSAGVVSGIIALWLNVHPYLDAYEIKRLLRESTVHYPHLERPVTLFGGVPNPLAGVKLLRPETLKPADGSRWDDLRFNLRRLEPQESTIYYLNGRIPEGKDDGIGHIVAYNVDFEKNYAVKDYLRLFLEVRVTKEPLDSLTIDHFDPTWTGQGAPAITPIPTATNTSPLTTGNRDR